MKHILATAFLALIILGTSACDATIGVTPGPGGTPTPTADTATPTFSAPIQATQTAILNAQQISVAATQAALPSDTPEPTYTAEPPEPTVTRIPPYVPGPTNTRIPDLVPAPTVTPRLPEPSAFLQDLSVAKGDAPEKGLAYISGQTFPHSVRYVFPDPCCSERSQSTSYNLGGHFQHFRANMGLDAGSYNGDTSSDRGRKVKYEVFLDEVRIYEQTISPGAKALPIDLDVSKGDTLRLAMTTGGQGPVTAIWGDAAVVGP